jgi:signal transduction histidine kinase/CheY-like chemotaxis protein/RNA polymerase subunit RPABC4/transcription elongation factor Spt4
MPTQDTKHPILLLDDRKAPREVLAKLLSKDFLVVAVETAAEACEKLKAGFCPTFIFADREAQDGTMVEDKALPELKRLAPDSLIVVFTREKELSRRDYYAIRAAGAVRILDKKTMGEQIDDIKAVTKEIEELLELRSALEQATISRDILLAAVTGADVGLTIIDRHHHVWFANEAQTRIVGGLCSGGLCWNLFDGHPTEMGPCWACGLRQVFETGKTVERVTLTRMKSGRTLWVSVQTTPIHAKDGTTIIAAREAVSPHAEAIVANMGRKNRMMAIAQGLLHIGFGRVRIYESDFQSNADRANKRLCAAVSYKDIPSPDGVEGTYGQAHANMSLDLNYCRYCKKAIADWKGLLVRKWDAHGPSEIAKRLGIEPPYFAVPIWSPGGDTLIGFLGADFGDMDKDRRECAIEYLAEDETLDWLRESVGAEVRNALLGAVAESPEALERYKVVQQAGLAVGAAESGDAATAALAKAFLSVLPKGCIVSARRKEGDGLLAEGGLCSPTDIGIPKVVALADSKSLAAYVVCTHHRPLWIDDYPQYRKEAIKEGRPPGSSLVSMKSMAHIPISFEGTIYGSLSIDSPNPIRWHEDGLVEPLMRLTSLTALVLREIQLHAGLEKAKAKNAALIAFAATATGDAIWGHWAIQRLQTLSATASRIHMVREKLRESVDDATRAACLRELENVGYGLDDVASLLKKGYPRRDEFEDLRCELHNTLDVVRKQYEKRGVTFVEKKQELWVAVPGLFLRRMVGFLLDNAIEVTGSLVRPKVSIECHEDGQNVYIDVIDNGPGFPDALRAKLLQERIYSEKKGEGLGLLICRGTALQYGGDLTIESYVKLTQVRLRLPLAKKGDS